MHGGALVTRSVAALAARGAAGAVCLVRRARPAGTAGAASSPHRGVGAAAFSSGKGKGKGGGHRGGDAMERLLSLCKRRGFVFPGSDIYGGLSTSYDYGPHGAQLKKNVMDKWWRDFVERRRECSGLDTSIIMSPAVWEASGHVANFIDPLVECRACNRRVRADKLLEKHWEAAGREDSAAAVAALELAEMGATLKNEGLACPECGEGDAFSDVRAFNLLFRTHMGPTEDSGSVAYLRPETAQGVYVHFANAVATTRARLPFGIGQMGKSFRNEISPGQFLFRTREFEQMELQYFVHENESSTWQAYWVDFCYDWLLQHGLNPEHVRKTEYTGDELAHYALACTDIEFRFPFGWDELWGIANRGSYDLRCHAEASGKDLRYVDPVTRERAFPHVIEPALGTGRLLLAILSDAFQEETVPDASGSPSVRDVLRLHEDFAPYRVAVLPLQRKPELVAMAEAVYDRVSEGATAAFDLTGSIGKRYRRQDEIGTPLCVTVDVDSLSDGCVTVRCRDTMAQVRISVDELCASPVRHDRFAGAFRDAVGSAASAPRA